jgi:hypothetical protein
MAKESKRMVQREIDFMVRKKAPKDMIRHERAEKAEMGYKDGGMIIRGCKNTSRGKKFSRAG